MDKGGRPTKDQQAQRALESEIEEFTQEFNSFEVDELKGYEEQNRQRISDAHFLVKMAFDEYYNLKTGRRYFAPVTTMQGAGTIHDPSVAREGSLHPKSTNYMVKKRFNKISWTKTMERYPIRGEAGKFEVFPNFTVLGTSGGKPVTVERSADKHRMAFLLGDEIAEKVLANKGDKGYMNVDIDISVFGFWEVIFSPKGSPNDPNDVALTHNGLCLQMKRQEKVILPGYFLEIADHAVYPVYTQTPETQRKVTGWVQFFPYTVLREADEFEYVKMKADGDRKAEEARRAQEVAA